MQLPRIVVIAKQAVAQDERDLGEKRDRLKRHSDVLKKTQRLTRELSRDLTRLKDKSGADRSSGNRLGRDVR
jgi:hypothetical protein